MSQRAPSLVSDTHYCVMGDVTIDDLAAIAAGVIIKASSGSRIIIGSGVSIAEGVCIQSRKGVLTIDSGAKLESGVLIVGSGKVGAKARISEGSTLIDPSVEAEAVLPPQTLSGDASSAQKSSSQNGFSQNGLSQNGFSQNGFSQSSSSQNSSSQTNSFDSSAFEKRASDSPSQNNLPSSSFSSNGFSAGGFSQTSSAPMGFSKPNAYQANSAQTDTASQNTFVEPGPIEPKPIQIPEIPQQANPFVAPEPLNKPFNQPFNQPGSNGASSNGVQSNSGSSSLVVPTAHNQVYGKDQLTQLISTLFPHRQPLDKG